MNHPNACAYTPGPWQVDDGEITASGFVLGLVYGTDDYPCSEDETREECKANARLIAAAPELLEACRAVLKDCSPSGSKDSCLSAHVYRLLFDVINKIENKPSPFKFPANPNTCGGQP